MVSTFHPVGSYPDGYWVETTGAITIELGVSATGGDWQWLQRRTKLRNLSLPAALTPRVAAGKRVVGGKYRFEVSVTMTGIGSLLSYDGALQHSG